MAWAERQLYLRPFVVLNSKTLGIWAKGINHDALAISKKRTKVASDNLSCQ
ncbi:hypothetical protein M131_1724 [Bacteroides fragilis str. S6R8]|nr:hypothetical protein M131_1724 [Bacteroides fragilis str. S6R8]